MIDGLLDVSLPLEETQAKPPVSIEKSTKPKRADSWERQANRERSSSLLSAEQPSKAAKHLFSVQPGGIAGYLASLSGIPSYGVSC